MTRENWASKQGFWQWRSLPGSESEAPSEDWRKPVLSMKLLAVRGEWQHGLMRVTRQL